MTPLVQNPEEKKASKHRNSADKFRAAQAGVTCPLLVSAYPCTPRLAHIKKKKNRDSSCHVITRHEAKRGQRRFGNTTKTKLEERQPKTVCNPASAVECNRGPLAVSNVSPQQTTGSELATDSGWQDTKARPGPPTVFIIFSTHNRRVLFERDIKRTDISVVDDSDNTPRIIVVKNAA